MANFSNSESLNRLSLFKQNYTIDSKDKEMVVVLFSGNFTVGNYTFSRKNVFDSDACGFFLANQEQCKIVVDEFAELCIIETVSDAIVNFSIIQPSQIVTRQVGSGSFNRTVKTIIDKSTGFKNLIIGETTKEAGNWSSWPPHKHDSYIVDAQSEQKEIYLYKFSRPNGFGIQLIYENGVINAQSSVVMNNSEIKIERGYHPVVSSPDSKMYYLWSLFGDNSFFKVYSDLDYSN
tara:strand:- start:203 stop:904 length:702 start_codon:yes stop_codon:yes gene_type:complete